MKKIVSLLLTAVLLAAMLGVFALPAWADESGDTSGSEPESPVLAEAGSSAADGMPPELGTTPVVSPSDDEFHAEYSLDKIDPEITDSPVKSDEDTEMPSAVKEGGKTPAKFFKLPIRSDGSVLSEGSLTIIVGVAAAVVFGLGGFFIGKAAGKKKKPATPDGENKDEE